MRDKKQANSMNLWPQVPTVPLFFLAPCLIRLDTVLQVNTIRSADS